MKRNKNLCGATLAVLVLTSFGACRDGAALGPETEQQFSLTTEPQDAVFFIETGLTGGMGSAPIVERENGRQIQFNGLPIFFDSSRVQEVQEMDDMPSCVRGTPLIIVSARIQLERRTGRNGSIPGAPTESFYSAVVLELRDVFIQAEACEPL